MHDAADGEGEGVAAGENQMESAEAMLDSMEEMLEGYEWASDDIMGRRTLTGAEQIEARLLDELMALEKVLSHGLVHLDRADLPIGQYLFVHRVR